MNRRTSAVVENIPHFAHRGALLEGVETKEDEVSQSKSIQFPIIQ